MYNVAMKKKKGAAPKLTPPTDTIASVLRTLSEDNLLSGLTAELAAWGTEIFDDNRVMEYDAGVAEIGRRMNIKATDARVYVANFAIAQGVQI